MTSRSPTSIFRSKLQMLRRASWILFSFLLILTCARLVWAAHAELLPDEAYYYLWAQHPNVCYYSNGPGIALSVLVGTSLLGRCELGVRLLSPFLALGTSLLLYFLARRLYRERIAFWLVVVLNLTPLFNFAACFLTPAPLSLFFWTAAMVCFSLAVQESPNRVPFWALTGFLIGCGFLCDYANAFQLISVLIFLITVTKHRREFRRPGVYVLFGIFCLFLASPIIWNMQHDWIGLVPLSSDIQPHKHLPARFSALFQFIGYQLAVCSPLFLIAMITALFGSIPRAFRSSKVAFLLSFSLPILLIGLIAIFEHLTQPSWVTLGFVSLSLLAVAWWLDVPPQNRILRIVAVVAVAIAGASSLLALGTDQLRIAGINLSYSSDPSASLHGWKTGAAEIERFRSAFEQKLGEPVFLIGNQYQTAAIVSFYLRDPRVDDPGHPPIYIPESQNIENEFSFWPRYDEFVEPADKSEINSLFSEQAGVNPFINRTALYITDSPEEAPPQNLQNSFTRWELVDHFQVNRRDEPLHQFRIFACYQYQTLPL
ncbi:MAG: glycosyltransferase family 39 protein [Verrucomicrobia bacterium]|nr:glycosyltransferase family 39 protein [Verrucomicrobiota bacterium]